MDDKIRKYLESTLLIEFGAATREDTNLFDAGLVDSFAFVQLVGFLEKEYAIEITDGEALSDALSSLSGIRSFVEAKVADARR